MHALKQVESRVPVLEFCREHGMGSEIFYNRRSEYGGMDASLISRIKLIAGEKVRIHTCMRRFACKMTC